MKRTHVVLGLVTVAVVLAGVIIVPRMASRTTAPSEQGVYYCPMHPTYTSDRPGDCPICNMRLVRRPSASAQPAGQPGAEHGDHAGAASFKTVCYLHNCPQLHQGTPCPMTVVAKPGEQVTCPICGTHVAGGATSKEKKILYWTDPMIPGYKADKPGKSPMGMELVPVYAEEAGAPMSAQAPAGYAPVLLSPQRQQLIGVRTQPVVSRDLAKTIRTVGRIAYDPELYQAQEEYLQSLRALERAERAGTPELALQAKQLADSTRIRLRLLGMSDALIDEMRAWEGPDQSLLLADPQRHVWVYATIYEYELPLVTVGQPVRVEVPAVPGTALEGTIASIDPVLDPQTRSARVRAVLQDPQGWLKPEMFVNVVISIPLGLRLAVPEEAIFNTGTRQIAFVDQGQGLFEPRDVTIGLRADGFAEITQGLAADERVVTSGNFLIDSESRLKAALEGVGGDTGHQHGQ